MAPRTVSTSGSSGMGALGARHGTRPPGGGQGGDSYIRRLPHKHQWRPNLDGPDTTTPPTPLQHRHGRGRRPGAHGRQGPRPQGRDDRRVQVRRGLRPRPRGPRPHRHRRRRLRRGRREHVGQGAGRLGARPHGLHGRGDRCLQRRADDAAAPGRPAPPAAEGAGGEVRPRYHRRHHRLRLHRARRLGRLPRRGPDGAAPALGLRARRPGSGGRGAHGRQGTGPPRRPHGRLPVRRRLLLRPQPPGVPRPVGGGLRGGRLAQPQRHRAGRVDPGARRGARAGGGLGPERPASPATARPTPSGRSASASAATRSAPGARR